MLLEDELDLGELKLLLELDLGELMLLLVLVELDLGEVLTELLEEVLLLKSLAVLAVLVEPAVEPAVEPDLLVALTLDAFLVFTEF